MNVRDARPVTLLSSRDTGAGERRARVEVRSDPRELGVVERLVEVLLSRSGVSAERANEIVLAVSEAVCNVMRHGYGGRTDRPVTIDVRVHGRLVRVAIEDLAPPPPRAVVDALCARTASMPAAHGADVERLAESGWGLALIAGASRAIRYRRTDGRNRLELDFTAAAAP